MTAPGILTKRASYVAGRWVDGDQALAVENPADETLVCELSATPLEEIRRAVAEARRSFDGGEWANLSAKERAQVLSVFIDYLESVREPFIATMVSEAGQPRMFAEMAQFSAGIA
ncbi:MAG TPA: aldehyde dehydrogenase family protein, partial [Acidimicrobiales bacterium]